MLITVNTTATKFNTTPAVSTMWAGRNGDRTFLLGNMQALAARCVP
jgi:hypothetical protein